MKFLFFYCLIIISVLAQPLSAQDKLDSLTNLLETTEDDSLRSELYFAMAKTVDGDDINKGIEYGLKSAELGILAGHPLLAADSYNYIGILYYTLGNYDKTLEYFYKTLSIHEQGVNKEKIGRVYNNIGLILGDLGRIEEAITYFEKSLDIKKELKDTLGIANSMSNLGLVYDKIGEYEKANAYYFKSYQVDLQMSQPIQIFKDLSNLGDNYALREMNDSARYYYQQAIAMMDKVEEPYNKSELMTSLARLDKKEGNYERALEKYQIALQLAQSVDAQTLIRDNYLGISEVYKLLGDYKESLENYEKYTSIQDTLFSQEQAQKLAQIESDYQFQSKENQIALLNKEAEIKDLRLSNTQMVLYWLGGIIVLIIFIIILQYRKNAYKTKANELLRSQNEEIIEKNRNIMDSIMCAKNIQEAILPDDDKLASAFKEAFIYSRARDVVNGDFYWFAERQDKVLVAAVDCTGHGVPAAFLNVMGNSILNQIVYESHIINPAKILEELNARVLKTLRSSKLYVQVDDGMDIGLCMIDKKSRQLSFAGAKRPLYLVHDKELTEFKGDHFPVGGMLYEPERKFHEHQLNLKANDVVYLFTDGIVDQFGGESNKKFMYTRLRALINDIADSPLLTQRKIIEQRLKEWQGSNEQTDDQLIIGVKV